MEAPHWWHDGADTVQPIVHTCWSVPRRGLTTGHKTDNTLNPQCISMRGSHFCYVCVCWGWGFVTKLNMFAGQTSLSIMEYVIQNQANDYLSSLQALTQFWFMIQINIDFPEAPPHLSISPFFKRMNDELALISNQLFLSSFYLSLDNFSVAPTLGNVSLSIELYLITNWSSDRKQGNSGKMFSTESITSS